MAITTVEIETPLIDHYSEGEIKKAIEERAEIVKKDLLGGIFYWLLLGVCAFKDLLDLAWASLALVGMGMSSTVIGAAVGIPLFVLAKLLALASGLGVSFLILTYLFASDSTTGVGIAGKIIGKGIGKALRRLLLIPLVIIIMDSMVPGVDALPITTICFIFTVWLENRIRKGGALGVATKLVVKELSSRKVTFRQKFNVKEIPY